MNTEHDDLLELSDHAWQRCRDRLTGLTDDEFRWDPVPGRFTTLAWRLHHIEHLLTEQRNAEWLAQPVTTSASGEHQDAASMLAGLDSAYASWRTVLAGATLAEPIGRAAGRYGRATRRSFVLHVLDELIHHAAEAALLRDLYAAR